MSDKYLCPKPLRIVGCYVLHVYCKYVANHHAWSEDANEFSGDNARDCMSQARKAGWVIHRDKTATCRLCAKETTA